MKKHLKSMVSIFLAVLLCLALAPMASAASDYDRPGQKLLALKEQYLPRGGSAVVETGVSISLPQCCAALVVSHPELLRCDIIAADAPADGTIRVKLFNLSRETSYILQKGDPVVRLLIVPTADASLVRSLT